ncbi:hypothetical protein [Treponema saccharophilum]|uniref:hypothetical protein n=1 Tax=Treponema saccharophilum TaxID=165 RepID=UPI00131F3BDB|nr:hypothetical protein [Treponema saccharophilum]
MYENMDNSFSRFLVHLLRPNDETECPKHSYPVAVRGEYQNLPESSTKRLMQKKAFLILSGISMKIAAFLRKRSIAAGTASCSAAIHKEPWH